MMVKIPTPHILDRKRRQEPKAPDLPEDVPMIEYRETKIINGVQEVKLHRVPTSEWDAYAKENGL